MDDPVADEPDLGVVISWAEFCAWATLAMTPVIWWLQGPSVSTDQFVVRTSLLVISAATGLSLRIWAIFQVMRTSSSETPKDESSPHADPTKTNPQGP